MSALAALETADVLPLPDFASYVAIELRVRSLKSGKPPSQAARSLKGHLRGLADSELPLWACSDYLFSVRVVYNGEILSLFGCGSDCSLD